MQLSRLVGIDKGCDKLKSNISRWAIWCLLPALLIFLVLVALHVGTVKVPIGGTIQSIISSWGFTRQIGNPLTIEQEAVLWYIRMPRILVGLMVGASLALAGVVMQGVFSNPLAEPAIMGVSSGAGLGAVLAISMGLTSLGMMYMPAFAFIGAMLAVGISILLTFQRGRVETVTLLLAGVAVSMLLGAFTSSVLTLMNEYRLKEFMFWMVGGLDFRRWEHVWIALGPFLGCGSILLLLGRQLNVLVLGDTEAKALGVPVLAYRLLFLGLGAILTATAVCVSGAIGFVGLVVPHIMRIIVGPDHRVLMPISAIAGALFLVFCDTLGRVLFSGVEIRVGIMTAVLGAPYFLYLLRRVQQGGL